MSSAQRPTSLRNTAPRFVCRSPRLPLNLSSSVLLSTSSVYLIWKHIQFPSRRCGLHFGAPELGRSRRSPRQGRQAIVGASDTRRSGRSRGSTRSTTRIRPILPRMTTSLSRSKRSSSMSRPSSFGRKTSDSPRSGLALSRTPRRIYSSSSAARGHSVSALGLMPSSICLCFIRSKHLSSLVGAMLPSFAHLPGLLSLS
jgi:hypothetical protein